MSVNNLNFYKEEFGINLEKAKPLIQRAEDEYEEEEIY
tara:strand:- start:361 stop:474 length:114 start_codon:yes stop_codon:yes gene_type:complete